jgi:predicted RNA-binding Zn ribbon-like protein
MKDNLPVIEEHIFTASDLVGGDVVLDFVNTMTGRNGHPREWIAHYAGLVNWAAFVGLLTQQACERLTKRSLRFPSQAKSALLLARDLRELLFTVLTQVIAHRKASEDVLTRLHAHWYRSVGAHALQSVDGHLQPMLSSSSIALDSITDALAIRAVQLLLRLPTSRVHMCSGPNCAWLFIDSSKAGRRRWCDMATCGNDAKAKRFYLGRKKAAKK